MSHEEFLGGLARRLGVTFMDENGVDIGDEIVFEANHRPKLSKEKYKQHVKKRQERSVGLERVEQEKETELEEEEVEPEDMGQEEEVKAEEMNTEEALGTLVAEEDYESKSESESDLENYKRERAEDKKAEIYYGKMERRHEKMLWKKIVGYDARKSNGPVKRKKVLVSMKKIGLKKDNVKDLVNGIAKVNEIAGAGELAGTGELARAGELANMNEIAKKRPVVKRKKKRILSQPIITDTDSD